MTKWILVLGAIVASSFTFALPAHAQADSPADPYQKIRQRAEAGSSGEQYRWAFLNETGMVIPQNYPEAMKWYRLAAEQEDPRAQTQIGNFYAKGKGVPQNYPEAIKWYQLAAEYGNADAQTALGRMYSDGKGVPVDLIKAHIWFSLAAEQAPWYANSGAVKRITQMMTQEQIAEAKQLAAVCLTNNYKNCN